MGKTAFTVKLKFERASTHDQKVMSSNFVSSKYVLDEKSLCQFSSNFGSLAQKIKKNIGSAQ
jgi:hypothetical protein